MKQLIKLFTVLSLATLSTFATVQSESNLAANTNKTILASPAVITSITLWSTNTEPTLVKLYDNFRVYTNAAWTNFTTSITTDVEEVITSTGTTNYYTNSVITRTASPTAAAENVEPPILRSIVVPAAANGPITITGPIYFNRRIVADISATGLSYVMDYSTP
jgi:hypothetical protein